MPAADEETPMEEVKQSFLKKVFLYQRFKTLDIHIN